MGLGLSLLRVVLARRGVLGVLRWRLLHRALWLLLLRLRGLLGCCRHWGTCAELSGRHHRAIALCGSQGGGSLHLRVRHGATRLVCRRACSGSLLLLLS